MATVALVIFGVLAAATLYPIWNGAGWPISHEGPLFAYRTYIYARHLSWLDPFPIWSSVDAGGFGSPLPLMYHKLFYMLAAPLALVTGSLKAAAAFTVALLLIAGAVGIYATLRALGATAVAALVGGCALITANYTITNWLVRGAMAEFCGAMVTPWALYFLLRSMQAGRVVPGLGVALGLLWLAHSVLAYFLALLLAVTCGVLASFGLVPRTLLNLRTALPALLAFSVLVAPSVLLMAVIGRDYDMTRILTPPYRPAFQFQPVLHYVWDSSWHFGRTMSGQTVQMDLAVLVLMVVSLGALRLAPPSGDRLARITPLAPYGILFVLAAVLQLPAAAPLYDWIPLAQYIQFPWRLLAIMTPTLIIVAVRTADVALPGEVRPFMLGAVAAWMVAACGAFVPLQDARFSFEPVQLAGVTFSGFREFEPRTALPRDVALARILERWTDSGCAYEPVEGGSVEVAAVTLRVSCGRAAILPLPFYATRMHRIRATGRADSQRCVALDDFPALCGAMVPGGRSEVTVQMPRLSAWKW